MEIKKIVDFSTDENCYILINNGHCVVIDPGCGTEEAIRFIKENNLKTDKILLTHCHWDHTVGAESLKEATGAKIFASAECKENIQNSKINVSELFNDKIEKDIVDEVIGEEEFEAAGIEFKCIKTPGHTNCSVCYVTENIIFTGDTLFSGTVGRWDFPTGNFKELESSIKNKLYRSENYKVYPGHGEETTTEKERLYNSCICG